MNEKEKKTASGVLHCTAFGDLRPADICEGCEECRRNNDFADRGGYPAMLLTGSRENLAAALRAPGVAMDDVVVVNAKRFEAMKDALEKIAAMEPGEYETEVECAHPTIMECYTCSEMQKIAREALEAGTRTHGPDTDEHGPASAELRRGKPTRASADYAGSGAGEREIRGTMDLIRHLRKNERDAK